MTRLLHIVLLLWLSLLPLAGAAAERVALVIGMSNYQFANKLANTGNDARAIAAALNKLDFDVTLLTDVPQQELISELASFAFRAETADFALVYYAGHGFEAQGENFLVPVDAQIAAPQDVARYTVSLSDMLNAVYGARKIRMVILDSCRNNPFPGMQVATGDTKIVNPAEGVRGVGGLAPVTPARGTLVAYAQRPGEVAEDGKGQPNSPFAQALLNALAQPELEIGMLFRHVRDDVLAATNQRQEPYVTDSLPKTLYYLSGNAEELAANKVEDVRVAWSVPRPELAQQLRALSAQGDTRSMVGLAYQQLNPDSAGYDPKAAAALLVRAAAAGDPEAQYELAKLYETGVGVDQDPVQALALYQAAAAQDMPDAVNDLGFLTYQGGVGLKPDPAAALLLFERAADLKQPEALYNFAALIDDGVVAGKGPAEAAFYLYQSLRIGSKAVLEVLEARPTMFKAETRRALQQRLASVDLYAGAIDGDFGPGTQRSIRAAFGLTE